MGVILAARDDVAGAVACMLSGIHVNPTVNHCFSAFVTVYYYPLSAGMLVLTEIDEIQWSP